MYEQHTVHATAGFVVCNLLVKADEAKILGHPA